MLHRLSRFPLVFAALFLLGWVCAAPAQDVGGQYRIVTTPPGANVTLNGNSKGQTPLALSGVEVGEQLLLIEKADHQPVRRTLHVAPNAREVIELVLAPLSALVIIDSNPQGAEVFIDSVSMGITPVLITDLPFGKHRVKITKSGFVTKEVEAKVDSRVPIKRVVDLTSNTATLELNSEPQDVQVLLNGADRGRTPVTLDRIPSGTVLLEMVEEGYLSYRQELRLDVGQTEQIRAVLTPIPGVLEIVTVPAEARIYVDDQFRGMSPLILKDVDPAEYSLLARKVGFEDMTRSVTVPRAASVIEEFRLTQTSGLLQITTQPAGVSIFVDGKLVGVTEAGTNATDRVSSPLRINYIEEGDHKLQLTKVGYFGRGQAISVVAQQTHTLHHTLKRRFIANYEVITSKGAVKGMFHEVDEDGAIRLEVSPGVIKTIQRSEIKSRRALRGSNIPPPPE